MLSFEIVGAGKVVEDNDLKIGDSFFNRRVLLVEGEMKLDLFKFLLDRFEHFNSLIRTFGAYPQAILCLFV